MKNRARILLIDENSSARASVASALREALPDAEILEAASGLDYAQHLASGGLTAALSASDLSWGRGERVLDTIKRRSPGCLTLVFDGSATDDRVASGEHGALAQPEILELSSLIQRRMGNAASAAQDSGFARADTTKEAPCEVVAPLREVLFRMQQHAYTMVERDLLDPYAKELMTGFLRASERAQAGIEHLLQVETPRRPAERVPVNLGDAVLESMRGMQADIHQTQARVSAGTLPTLLADHGELVQLFYNLIDNAIKFRGTHPPRIIVRAERERDHWLISVSDNGLGVTSGAGDSIFAMFTRMPRNDSSVGAGIGLAMCKRIARSYDGDIWYKSKQGQGATFVVKLCTFAVQPVEVELTVQCNGRPVGRITVLNAADKNEVTRAALAIPALSRRIGESAVKDVQLQERAVVNIVA